MKSNERWKTIVGFDSRYQVSNFGNVRTHDYRRLGLTAMLKQSLTPQGYMTVSLAKTSGERKSCLVHRLVAEAFLDNPFGYPIINHKDENKTNNCVDNLEWCTYRHNLTYGSRIDHIRKPILAITEDHKIEKYDSATTASTVLGVSRAGIVRALKNDSSTCCGRRWYYINKRSYKCKT